MKTSNLERFVQGIMSIEVLRMDGASAGILGTAGADSDVVHSLKKTTIAFASEYCKAGADQNMLERLAQEIDGLLRTTQLTHTISEERATKLVADLNTLMALRPA